MIEIDAVYQPRSYEDRIWKFWMDLDLFYSQPQDGKKPYTILMPPPNVTSQLHMGHGLGYSIQDLLIRWRRMQGYNAMWLPGTDHAGIATQMMVEKSLEDQNLSRKQLGREAFVSKCQLWKDKYGGMILDQFAKMGFSCDWRRVSYTMDPHLSYAVRWVFVKLFEEGLIYRGERLVNWDPVLKTALSDDEVETKEIVGHLWHFRYPIDGTDEFIPIATTRPETMLGDTAVAVHPADERYVSYIGKFVRLPFCDRLIPIIADDYVKSEFGTGAVKITPAHDPNDFEIGKRHHLPMITILNDDATLNDQVPVAFRNLDRFEARRRIVSALKERGLFDKEQSYKHAVPHSERSKAIIEPKLSWQWYVKAKDMAKEAAEAARSGELNFYPDSWKKTYLYWLDNIQDWCISRQLWWGHRLPIWYCDDCQQVMTGMTDPDHCSGCQSPNIHQDEDVLDTWFSSWLWPLSPFGWPDRGRDELKYYYPTSTLVTAPEIIFLWVARMVMIGKKFLGDVPFRDVYFNATVCDKKGRKFSKTLGNGIDPLEVISSHGADAVRYTAISLAPLGGRVRMSRDDFDNGSKFINKLWNAARLILRHLSDNQQLPSLKNLELNQPQAWLIDEFNRTAQSMNQCLEQYRINEAVEVLYHFIWGSLCDWALEAAKESLGQPDDRNTEKDLSLSVLVYVLDGALRLAHPIIPFVTEELWQKLPSHPDWNRPASLAIAEYPQGASEANQKADQWRRVQDVIARIRSTRTQAGIVPQEALEGIIKASPELVALFTDQETSRFIKRLARLSDLKALQSSNKPTKSLAAIGPGYTIYLPIEGLIDIEKETKRLQTEAMRLEKVIQGMANKLLNQDFVNRAPPEVLLETQTKHSDLEVQLSEIKVNIEALTQ